MPEIKYLTQDEAHRFFTKIKDKRDLAMFKLMYEDRTRMTPIFRSVIPALPWTWDLLFIGLHWKFIWNLSVRPVCRAGLPVRVRT